LPRGYFLFFFLPCAGAGPPPVLFPFAGVGVAVGTVGVVAVGVVLID
jgi:hypothetical protein